MVKLSKMNYKNVMDFAQKWFEDSENSYCEVSSCGFEDEKYIVRYFDQTTFEQLEFSKFEVKDTGYIVGARLQEDINLNWRKFMYSTFENEYSSELKEHLYTKFENKKQGIQQQLHKEKENIDNQLNLIIGNEDELIV